MRQKMDGLMKIQENNEPQCYIRIINTFHVEIINVMYHVPVNVRRVVL